MADKLREMYNNAGITADLEPYQIFQRGVTAGAVSMRTRAMSTVQKYIDGNHEQDVIVKMLSAIKNETGQMSDIPQE